MSQDQLAKMECTGCHRITHRTTRHKKRLAKVRLELKKHCKWCSTHTQHKETK